MVLIAIIMLSELHFLSGCGQEVKESNNSKRTQGGGKCVYPQPEQVALNRAYVRMT